MATEKKMYKFEEVAKHNKKEDCWLIMFGKVYDVTSFMDDHPGGDDVMISSTGKDATGDFEDVGHSKTATDMLDKYYIGDIDPSTYKATHVPPSNKSSSSDRNDKVSTNNSSLMTKMLQLLVPIIVLGLALAVKKFTKVD